MNTASVALVMAVAVAAAFGSASDNECTSLNGQVRDCRIIRDCPSLLALLTGQPSQEDLNILHGARCGFEGNDPMVCCPDSDEDPPQTTDRMSTFNPWPLPTLRPTRRPTKRPGGSSNAPPARVESAPPDVGRHPNLRLLRHELCSPGGDGRIVGGKVADVFAYPFIARLGYQSRVNPRRRTVYGCGGALISDRYVLTAAHCIHTQTDLNLVTVKLGEHTIDREVDCRTNNGGCIPPPIDIDVEQTIVHPGYDLSKNTKHHDIAIARLAKPVDFRPEAFVRPVCLPISAENRNLDLDRTSVLVAGWGLTEYGEGSKALKDVSLPVVALQRCQAIYKRPGLQREIVPQQLCAGGEKGKDSCVGDSGGPLMLEANVDDEFKTVLFGVVSYGPTNCGTQGVPGVYTRVSFYMKWILDNMKP